MSKINCEIIKDLLPLYADKVCSSETQSAVEEHIGQCSACKEFLSAIESAPSLPVGDCDAQKAVIKVGKKLKKRTKKAVINTICVTLSVMLVVSIFAFLTVPLKLAEKEFMVSGLWDMQCNCVELNITNKQKPNFNGKYGKLYIDPKYGKYTISDGEYSQQLVFEDGKKITFMNYTGEVEEQKGFRDYCSSEYLPFITTNYPFLMPVVKRGAENLGISFDAIDNNDFKVFKTLAEISPNEVEGYSSKCAYYFLFTIAMPLSNGHYIVTENDLYEGYGWSLYNSYGVNHLVEIQLKKDIDKSCSVSFSGFLQDEVAEIFDSFVLV